VIRRSPIPSISPSPSSTRGRPSPRASSSAGESLHGIDVAAAWLTALVDVLGDLALAAHLTSAETASMFEHVAAMSVTAMRDGAQHAARLRARHSSR
jgi:hypothetical protein